MPPGRISVSPEMVSNCRPSSSLFRCAGERDLEVERERSSAGLAWSHRRDADIAIDSVRVAAGP
jgi:hypothetical protein